MQVIRADDPGFPSFFQRLQTRGKVFDARLWEETGQIVQAVARDGDAALFSFTERFDGHRPGPDTLSLGPEPMAEALAALPPEDAAVLRLAAERIQRFHRWQRHPERPPLEEEGIHLSLKATPLETVGVYAPGGRAAYPSTVLMAAIPARVAGVGAVFLATPAPNGVVNPLVLAAAAVAGVDRVYRMGGAQAIAAFAFGTSSVPRVDKIVGPGNAYVAAAKKMVFGQVAIDMIAGPSEIAVVADETADPAWIAADLLAQAEHDPLASAALFTPAASLGEAVAAEVHRQLRDLSRQAIAAASLRDWGAVILTADLAEALALVNRFAPEHVELAVASPEAALAAVRNAGAVFLGPWTPEALGDYLAGPNHILPTGGTARFASPLGVADFLKHTSVLSFPRDALQRYGPAAARFARLEGLEGHGASIRRRLAGNTGKKA